MINPDDECGANEGACQVSAAFLKALFSPPLGSSLDPPALAEYADRRLHHGSGSGREVPPGESGEWRVERLRRRGSGDVRGRRYHHTPRPAAAAQRGRALPPWDVLEHGRGLDLRLLRSGFLQRRPIQRPEVQPVPGESVLPDERDRRADALRPRQRLRPWCGGVRAVSPEHGRQRDGLCGVQPQRAALQPCLRRLGVYALRRQLRRSLCKPLSLAHPFSGSLCGTRLGV